MKTLHRFFTTVLFLLFITAANAQWSAVRFDQQNTFTKVYAASQNTAFAIGTGWQYFSDFMLRTNDGGATWDSISVSTINDTFQLSSIFFPDINTGFTGGI